SPVGRPDLFGVSRTRATPVSSQEVSIPKITLPACPKADFRQERQISSGWGGSWVDRGGDTCQKAFSPRYLWVLD
ncbi:MAG: hypothetical protein ACK5FO_05365, partial [Burkholderiales bacterium]